MVRLSAFAALSVFAIKANARTENVLGMIADDWSSKTPMGQANASVQLSSGNLDTKTSRD